MRHLSIDLETFSSEPIAKTGMYKYVQSPDFEILLLAYSLDRSPVQIIDLAQGERIPQWLQDSIQSPDYLKHAYNASFEWYCLSKFFGRPLPVNQWRDTMTHGLYCGLTAGLDATGKALGLPEDKRKLITGKALIRYFSIPCKPTKTNGNRTRNYPKHDPEKWALFKEYCKGDVVTETAIEDKLSNFPVPDDIQKQWETDLIINSRGVAVDMDFVQGALEIAEKRRNTLTAEAFKITGLQNPNSVSQLTAWLESNTDRAFSDLRKDTVARILKNNEVGGGAKRILEIRQELGKTSTKKYDAIQSVVGHDGRVRGLLQFYGASRTGRYAGRLIQVQNLARTYIDVKYLPLAREIVKKRESEKLNILYGSIMDTLSQLIRTSFVASEGKTLIDADFSSIEARVIAWLAGEEWKVQVFNENKDVYCETASVMFGVPVEKHGANSHLRQKGKVAELACIAEGQLVLTNKGLIPIEQIKTEHKLWDGEEWISHEGVIFKGEREVITYEGLTATTDHLVWIEGQKRPVHFGFAASCGAHLVQTGDGRAAIRLGENNKPGKTLGRKVEPLLCSDKMHRLRKNTMTVSQQFTERKIERLSELFPTETNSTVARQKIDGGKTTLSESKRPRISQLRGERNKILLFLCAGCRFVDFTKFGIAFKVFGNRQNKQQWQLRTRKFKVCDTKAKHVQQKRYCLDRLQPESLALRIYCGDSEIVTRFDTRRNNCRRKESCRGKTQKLEKYSRKVRVYDIRNAGKRHRFTVSGKLVHNCGYGGSTNALIAMGALDMGIPESDLQDIVTKWRQSNKQIVRFWYAIENAATKTIKTGESTAVGNITFRRETDPVKNMDFMTIQLPGGRKLYYSNPSIGLNRWGSPSIIYYGVNQTTNQWTEIETYGGKLAENITQSVARDCLAEAIERLESEGFPIVFHVHDEVVIEIDKDKADLNKVVDIMTRPPKWAKGLPINADGWVGDYFRKD